jgi:GxxExxY protein
MEHELEEKIIQAATEVHQSLGGPGLLETVYESALCHELSLRGIQNQRQLPIPVFYKSKKVRDPLFLDILVEDKLIIEVKATGKDYPIYYAQLFTHLRLTGIKTGLIINFGKEQIKNGILRMINDQAECSHEMSRV